MGSLLLQYCRHCWSQKKKQKTLAAIIINNLITEKRITWSRNTRLISLTISLYYFSPNINLILNTFPQHTEKQKWTTILMMIKTKALNTNYKSNMNKWTARTPQRGMSTPQNFNSCRTNIVTLQHSLLHILQCWTQLYSLRTVPAAAHSIRWWRPWQCPLDQMHRASNDVGIISRILFPIPHIFCGVWTPTPCTKQPIHVVSVLYVVLKKLEVQSIILQLLLSPSNSTLLQSIMWYSLHCVICYEIPRALV